jgi:hypothetical protein
VIFDAAAVVGTRLHHAARSWKRRAAVGWLGVTGRPTAAYQPPVIWPPPLTYRDMRRLATGVLAAARYRRHLCWRHSLVWTKPP